MSIGLATIRDKMMREEFISVPGLDAPAEINVDTWGVAHIRATNRADLFFVQGFNVARDRLWQIDLWRKRGLGLLAADFGPGYLEQDRASRLFLYRGDLAAEWAAYDGDAEATCKAFVAGLNAYIDLIEKEPERLPPEFQRMETRPLRWRPEDVVRIRSHALSRNALSEVMRANVMARSDAGIDLLRQELNPPAMPQPAAGIDLRGIPAEVLDLFKLAAVPVGFESERLDASLDEAPQWRKLSILGEVERDAAAQGSNNWVVHGTRTASGRPVLANDPHRVHAIPSLRYLVHLSSPELDVIGAGEPILPGVSIGHNGTIAFGLTIFTGPDQEDVYVYETAPDRPNTYKFGDGWEDMHLVSETIPVKGHADQLLILKFTRHGPVIFEDPIGHRAFAIRSVWFEPGSAPYFASIAAMSAKNFAEFNDYMKRWAVPTVNQVYADIAGNIGWLAAAHSPIRPNWDGLLPVPGDGRFEWNGFLTSEQLPHRFNPASGFCATANEMNLPPDWEGDIGREWLEDSRAQRITGRLAGDDAHSLAASCALQNDITSLPAQRLCRLLRACSSPTDVLPGLALLSGWDGELHADSAAAALFEVWWTRHLRPLLFQTLTADPQLRTLLGPGDPGSVLRLLENPDERFGDRPEQARDQILTASLQTAFQHCIALMGEDVAGWSWGRLHKIHFDHALSRLDGTADLGLDAGPFPQGGSSSTPMNSSYRASDFRVTVGASVRLVLDVGDWDKSLCINSPGQSGNPASRHYADLAPAWAKGQYVPLLYSQAAIDARTETRIRLSPAS